MAILETMLCFVEIKLMSSFMISNVYGIYLETFLDHLK